MKLVYAALAAGIIMSGCGDSRAQSEPAPEILGQEASQTDPELAQRFSRLALDCVQQEYPNKIAHVFQSGDDVGTPRELYPAFYGCFDWHSSVHGHWMLVRLLRTTSGDAPWKDEARAKLAANLTPENIAGETAYLTTPGRGSFERPYGLAWLLQLTTELRQWDDPQAKQWLAALEPLEAASADKVKSWLPNLAYPIHLGTHNQSAFAFGLMLDWAREAGDAEMETLLIEKSLAFHKGQTNCPIGYEPSGEDFLSACLMTADLMRRILPEDEFADWLAVFLPNIPTDGSNVWLEPGIVKDASDGKLVHLDGVNLSRAWNLRNLAYALPGDDPRRAALQASAKLHSGVGQAAVTSEHYSGSHWLASYAVYLISDRGITQ